MVTLLWMRTNMVVVLGTTSRDFGKQIRRHRFVFDLSFIPFVLHLFNGC